MKSICDSLNHTPNYSSSCCLTQLILMFNKTENNSLFIKYGLLLLKTLNKFLKNDSSILLSENITLDQLCIFTEILTKYSSIFYYRCKFESSKLLIKFGIDSINQSKYKTELKVVERKNALANNIACIYEKEGNYNKASLFFEKLINLNTSSNKPNCFNLDKALTYNNLGIIEMKKCRIAEGINYFNLAYEEVKDKIKQNISQLKQNKIEVIVLIIFNYCFAYKRYLNKCLDEIYSLGLEYSVKYLGMDHHITVYYNDRKLDAIESICSTDSSPEVPQSKDNNFLTMVQCTTVNNNSNQNKKENKTDNMFKKNVNNLNNQTQNEFPTQLQSTIQIDNPSVSQMTKKKETKTLPFRKKKLTLKECFSTAYQSFKPQPESHELFTALAKNIKAQKDKEQKQATLLSKLEKSKEILSPNISNTQNINKYNDMMSKFELTNIKGTLIPNTNSNNQPNVQSLKEKTIVNNCKTNSQKTTKLSTRSIFSTQNTKKGTTEIFKHLVSINKGNINHPLVEASTDFEVVDNLNNLYLIKIKNDNNYEKDIDNIIERSLKNPLKGESKRIHSSKDNKPKQMIIMSNNDNNKSILISIIDLLRSQEIYTETLNYADITNCLSKIFFYSSMPQHCNLSFLSNITKLVNTVLIKHCQLILNKTNNSQELVLLKYQMSISRQSFVLSFINTNCVCSLFEDNHDITLVVYSQENKTLSLRVDIYLDEGCFNTFFIEKEEKGVKILFYQDNFNYEDFFATFFIKIQEILKVNIHNKSSLSFEEILLVYSKSIFKLDIQEKLKQKDFWIINKDPKAFQWRIDLFTLEKIQITNGAYYINKQIILDSEDFINIIGSDPRDVWEKMSDKDMIIAHKILMNTVKMRNIMLKILTEKNYDSMLKLIKIKPSCFFRFTFVILHIKKYFCCAFEFIVYSKENYFLRLMLTETITSRSYSKLYLPYYMNKTIHIIEELKKILVEEYKLKKEMLSNKKRLRNVLVDEAWGILTKNSNVVFYENIDIILNKFKKT